MNRRMRIASMVLTAVLLGKTSVLASPLTDQLKQNKSQLKAVQDKRQEMEAQIEDMDVQIENLMSDLDNNKNQISQVEDSIKKTKVEVDNTKKELENDKDQSAERLRAMYIYGDEGYLSMLLGSKSLGDLISRVEIIKKIINFDNQTLQELNAKQKELDDKTKALNQKETGLVLLKKSNEEKLLALSNSKNQESKLIDEAKNQEVLYAAKVDASQALVNISLKQIQQIRKEVPKYFPSRGAVQISNNAVLAYASNFLGTPYVWGGTTPSPGFDCSGFVQYVYAHFGIQLGRTTWDQINDGVSVPKDQLQPGDIVFFGKGGNPTHEGIYVGNNTYINAPRTGDVVKIAPATRSDYITARRVIR